MINKKLINQILKFGLIGGIAFVIDYVLLFLLKEYANLDVLVASAISFSISVIFNYIMSIKWVFDVKKKQGLKEFIVFMILSVIGLLINELIMHIMVNIICIYYMISKLFATAIVMVYNFITRKIFIEGK